MLNSNHWATITFYRWLDYDPTHSCGDHSDEKPQVPKYYELLQISKSWVFTIVHCPTGSSGYIPVSVDNIPCQRMQWSMWDLSFLRNPGLHQLHVLCHDAFRSLQSPAYRFAAKQPEENTQRINPPIPHEAAWVPRFGRVGTVRSFPRVWNRPTCEGR